MTFALTKVRAFGIEAEEAVNKRYRQVLVLDITAANTDVDLDLGDYSGTFWSAVGGSQPGTTALAAIKQIQIAASTYIGVGGSSLAPYAPADSSITQITKYDSTATAGTTGATRTLAVTGLQTTDTILSFTIVEDGATPVYVQEAAKTCAVNDQYVVTFSDDPGAGLEGRVMVSKATAVTAVQAGTYQVAMDSTNTHLPNILFLSGDAPTSYKLQLEWTLKDAEQPISVALSA